MDVLTCRCRAVPRRMTVDASVWICRRVGMQMRMSVEEKERKNELTVCGCADANECKKKEKKEKKNLLRMGACRRKCVAVDGIACGCQ